MIYAFLSDQLLLELNFVVVVDSNKVVYNKTVMECILRGVFSYQL